MAANKRLLHKVAVTIMSTPPTDGITTKAPTAVNKMPRLLVEEKLLAIHKEMMRALRTEDAMIMRRLHMVEIRRILHTAAAVIMRRALTVVNRYLPMKNAMRRETRDETMREAHMAAERNPRLMEALAVITRIAHMDVQGMLTRRILTVVEVETMNTSSQDKSIPVMRSLSMANLAEANRATGSQGVRNQGIMDVRSAREAVMEDVRGVGIKVATEDVARMMKKAQDIEWVMKDVLWVLKYER